MRVLDGETSLITNMPGKKKHKQRKPSKDVSESSDESRPVTTCPGKRCVHVAKAVNFASMRKSIVKQKFAECTECCKLASNQKKGDNQNSIFAESSDAAGDEGACGESETSVWVCLQCGHQGCDRNSTHKHALKHTNTPHSSPHSIVINLSTWIVWCYACDDEILPDKCKRVIQCLEFLKKQDGYDPPMEYTNDATSNVVSVFTKPTPQTSKNTCQKVKGLSNLGNTCFFNAIMQNLSCTSNLDTLMCERSRRGYSLYLPGRTLTEEVDSDDQQMNIELPSVEVTLPEAGSLTSAFLSFLRDMNSSSKNVSPNNLFTQVCKKAPRFRSLQQQDSHELLRYLLDNMKTEEIKRAQAGILKLFKLPGNVNPKKVDGDTKTKIKEYGRQGKLTIIDQMFGGVLLSTIICDECQQLSTMFEPFLDLSLSITEEKPARPTSVSLNKKTTEERTLPSADKPNKQQIKKNKKQAKREKKQSKYRGGRGLNKDHTHSVEGGSVGDDGDTSDADIEDNTESDASRMLTQTPDTDIIDTISHTFSKSCDISASGDITRSCDTPPTNTKVDDKSHKIDDKIDDNIDSVTAFFSAVSINNVDTASQLVHDENDVDDKQVLCDEGQLATQDGGLLDECPPDLSRINNCELNGENVTQNCRLNEGINDDNMKQCFGTDQLLHDSVAETFDDIRSGNDDLTCVDGACVSKLNTDDNNIKNNIVNGLDQQSGETTTIHDSNSNSLNCVRQCCGPIERSESLQTESKASFTPGRGNLIQSPRTRTKSESVQEVKRKALLTLTPRYHPEPRECSVLSCLYQFTSAELLTGNNKFGCEKCARKNVSPRGKQSNVVYSNASKHYLIFTPPAVLTLHFKRFEQVGFSSRKVNRHVDFDFLLNLSPFCSTLTPVMSNGQKQVIYSLYGVIEHSGRLTGGHYTAYIKVRTSNHSNNLQFLNNIPHLGSYFNQLIEETKPNESLVNNDDSTDTTDITDSTSDLFNSNSQVSNTVTKNSLSRANSNLETIIDTNRDLQTVAKQNHNLETVAKGNGIIETVGNPNHDQETVANPNNMEETVTKPNTNMPTDTMLNNNQETMDQVNQNIANQSVNESITKFSKCDSSTSSENERKRSNSIHGSISTNSSIKSDSSRPSNVNKSSTYKSDIPMIPTGRWYHISDNHVSEVTESSVKRSQAYMLFYERIV